MSDQEFPVTPPTSPTMDTDSGIVTTAKQFSGNLTLDLTDEEIAAAYRIITRIKAKWQEKFRRKFNDPNSFELDDVLKLVAEFEDEIKTTLAEQVNILATVNTVPILEGQPLEIDFIGKMPSSSDVYGFDHEKKEWEVKRANANDEDFLGQKG